MELPKKRIIANCFAAMNPSDRLWSEYLDKINSLAEKGQIQTSDYDLLRYDNSSKQVLMDNTLGGGLPLVEGTIEEILERARKHAKKDVEYKLTSAEAEKRQTSQKNNELSDNLEATNVALAKEKSTREAAEEENKRLRKTRAIQEATLSRIALGVKWVVNTLIFAFITALYVRYQVYAPKEHSRLNTIGGLIGVLLSIANFALGISAKSAGLNLGSWTSGRVAKFLGRLLNIDEPLP